VQFFLYTLYFQPTTLTVDLPALIFSRNETGTTGIFSNMKYVTNYTSTNLSFSVDTNNTIAWVMWCCDKDRVTTDTVHVDTRATLDVVQMDITIFGDEEHYAMFLTHLERVWSVH
jgi:hypothetical protein